MFGLGKLSAIRAACVFVVLATSAVVRAGVDPEACCLPNGNCIYVPAENCTGTPQGPGTVCSPSPCPPVPAMGTWGMIAVAGLLLFAGTYVMRRQQRIAPTSLATVAFLVGVGAAYPPDARAQSIAHSAIKIQDRERDGTRQIVVNPFGPRDVNRQIAHPRWLSRNERPNPKSVPLMEGVSPNVRHEVFYDACGEPIRGEVPPPQEAFSPTVGEVQVLGLQIQYGILGNVPVRLESKLAGDVNFTPRFGGADLAAGAIESINLGLNPGTLTFKFQAAFDPYNSDGDGDHWTNPLYYREVLSDDVNCVVLMDGDNLNDVIAQKGIQTPYGGQLPISSVLQYYLDSSGNVSLDSNRVLVLAELGTNLTNPANCASSPSCDFQDAVMVLDLDGIVQAPDVYIASAIGTPHTGFPGDVITWSAVRASLGASQSRALAYSTTWDLSPTDTHYYIHACVLSGDSNWNDCAPVEVIHRVQGPGDVFMGIADMAITNNAVHAVGWVERNTTSGLVNYYVAFTSDNGASWAVPILLGSYVSIPGSSFAPYDIDLAANEAGDIAVLAYFKQTGTSPAPNPTEPNTLVMFVFPQGNTTTPTKVAITPGSGTVGIYNSTCKGTCFSLTGDSGNTFHAFYYTGSSPTYSARVSTVDNAVVTNQRLIVNNNQLSTLSAAQTSIGAAFFATSGPAFGCYDVPTSGTISFRAGSQLISLPGAEIDDGPYSTNVRLTTTSTGVSNPPSGSGVFVKWATQSGQDSGLIQINDISMYAFCSVMTAYVGDHCYNYSGPKANGLGGVLLGDVYYSSSLLTEYTWDGSGYVTDDTFKQHVVVHQTRAEY